MSFDKTGKTKFYKYFLEIKRDGLSYIIISIQTVSLNLFLCPSLSTSHSLGHCEMRFFFAFQDHSRFKDTGWRQPAATFDNRTFCLRPSLDKSDWSLSVQSWWSSRISQLVITWQNILTYSFAVWRMTDSVSTLRPCNDFYGIIVNTFSMKSTACSAWEKQMFNIKNQNNIRSYTTNSRKSRRPFNTHIHTYMYIYLRWTWKKVPPGDR